MKIGHSAPVDKTAYRVTRDQHVDDSYEIKNKDQKLGVSYWKAPKLMSNPPREYDVTGVKFGFMTVIGYLGKGKWQCKCKCGNYTSRRYKAITNPNNDVDACEECRELAYIKRTYDFCKTGKNKDVKDYYR